MMIQNINSSNDSSTSTTTKILKFIPLLIFTTLISNLYTTNAVVPISKRQLEPLFRRRNQHHNDRSYSFLLPTNNLRRASSPSTCSSDLEKIGTDLSLHDEYVSIEKIYESSLKENTLNFCTINDNIDDAGSVLISCMVNFTAWSDNYVSICEEQLGGSYSPIQVSMNCTRTGKKKNTYYNISYTNVPACVGKQCSGKETNDALLGIIHDMVNDMTSDDSDNMVCDFTHLYYHNDDDDDNKNDNKDDDILVGDVPSGSLDASSRGVRSSWILSICVMGLATGVISMII